MKRTRISCAAAWTLTAAALLTTGCHVNTSRNGKNEDVNIATPFGGMNVQTGQNAVLQSIGLPVYPGATLVTGGDDDNAANVHLNFGNLHLGVQAVSYRTPDAPGQVLAYYRRQMARYGVVVLCQGNQPVGQPTVTQDGLNCRDDGHTTQGKAGGDHSAGELKAGSKHQQHLVPVDRDGTGTKFALIALDLPESGGKSGGKGGDTD